MTGLLKVYVAGDVPDEAPYDQDIWPPLGGKPTVEKRYSEDQPRGPDGKFVGGGGADKGGGKPTGLNPEMVAAADIHGPHEDAVARAMEDMKAGRETTITAAQLPAVIAACKTSNEPINLHNLAIAGEPNMFSSCTMCLTRVDMPVISDTADAQNFMQDASRMGVTSQWESVDPRTLIATQNELDGVKVATFTDNMEENHGVLFGKEPPPCLVIDQAGSILDGHHRWAAAANYAVTHPGFTVPVLRVNTNINTLVAMGHRYDASIPGHEKAKAFGQTFQRPRWSQRYNPKADPTGWATAPDGSRPPSMNQPYFWLDGKGWLLMATDTQDGVPRQLSFKYKQEQAARMRLTPLQRLRMEQRRIKKTKLPVEPLNIQPDEPHLKKGQPGYVDPKKCIIGGTAGHVTITCNGVKGYLKQFKGHDNVDPVAAYYRPKMRAAYKTGTAAVLTAVMRPLTIDSYVLGTIVAAAPISKGSATIQTAIATSDPPIDLGATEDWAPGWAEDPGNIPDDSDMPSGLSDKLEALGAAAAAIVAFGILDDPTAQADQMTNTTEAQGTNLGSTDAMQAAGFTQMNVVLDNDGCQRCQDAVDGGPYDLDDDSVVPVHNNCGCGIEPVTGETRSTPSSENRSRRYSEDQERGPDGRFGSGGGGAIKASEIDTTKSEAVTPEAFKAASDAGKVALTEITKSTQSTAGIDGKAFDAVKASAFAEVQKSWGGQTISPVDGKPISPTSGFAVTARPSGTSVVSIGDKSTEAQFNAAMDKARETFASTLAKSGTYLGVFHDDDKQAIEIDPTVLAKTETDAKNIAAYTHSVGGAYDFSTGNGVYPPHVADTATRNIRQEDRIVSADVLAAIDGRVR